MIEFLKSFSGIIYECRLVFMSMGLGYILNEVKEGRKTCRRWMANWVVNSLFSTLHFLACLRLC